MFTKNYNMSVFFFFFGNDHSFLLPANPRRFWRVLNQRSNPDIAITNHNGDIVSDFERVELLNSAFSSVLTREDLTSSPINTVRTDITMPDFTITEKGIYSFLNNPKLSSASDHLEFNQITKKYLS